MKNRTWLGEIWKGDLWKIETLEDGIRVRGSLIDRALENVQRRHGTMKGVFFQGRYYAWSKEKKEYIYSKVSPKEFKE